MMAREQTLILAGYPAAIPIAASHPRPHLRVSQVMRWRMHTAPISFNAAEARLLAQDLGVHQLPVLELGMPAGLVCLCDLTDAPDSAPVSRFLHKPMITLPFESLANEAALLMRHWRVTCLHVLYRGFLVGLVTASDLVRAGELTSASRPRCLGQHRSLELQGGAP